MRIAASTSGPNAGSRVAAVTCTPCESRCSTTETASYCPRSSKTSARVPAAGSWRASRSTLATYRRVDRAAQARVDAARPCDAALVAPDARAHLGAAALACLADEVGVGDVGADHRHEVGLARTQYLLDLFERAEATGDHP